MGTNFTHRVIGFSLVYNFFGYKLSNSAPSQRIPIITYKNLIVINLANFLIKFTNKVHHRFTYPKGVHSYRYFLQPMRTPNSLLPAHAYSPILLLATHAYMQLDLYAYTMVYALAV